MKKPPTYPHDEAVAWAEQLSKAALVDLLLDAMEIVLDDCDPSKTVEGMREWAAPRMEIRGDRLPPVKPSGRPQKPPLTFKLSETEAITRAVAKYLAEQPVQRLPERSD